MSQRFKIIVFILTLVAALVWLVVITWPKDTMRIVACDVGQGDAILIIHKSAQILVDGGPNNTVIDCLGRYVPFWDRNLEMVILTHPDLDHYGGLDEVFDQYQVNMFVANAVDSSTKAYQALKSQVGGLKLNVTNPNNFTLLTVGEMTIDVVSPVGTYNQQVLGAYTTSEDSNNFSVVFNLTFGEFDALFTGDIGPEIMNQVIATGEIRDIEYLQVPHHGSKNGLTKALLDLAKPELAVISAGKQNRYGHPSPEILDILQGIKTLRTDLDGDIVVETDGKNWWVAQ